MTIACSSHGGSDFLKIGDQIWMAYDLTLDVEDSWIVPVCNNHRYYKWSAIQQIEDSLPEWKVPNNSDWFKLINHFGITGDELKKSNFQIGEKIKRAFDISTFSGGSINRNDCYSRHMKMYLSRDTITTSSPMVEKFQFVFSLQKEGPKKNILYKTSSMLKDSIGYSVRLIKRI